MSPVVLKEREVQGILKLQQIVVAEERSEHQGTINVYTLPSSNRKEG